MNKENYDSLSGNVGGRVSSMVSNTQEREGFLADSRSKIEDAVQKGTNDASESLSQLGYKEGAIIGGKGLTELAGSKFGGYMARRATNIKGALQKGADQSKEDVADLRERGALRTQSIKQDPAYDAKPNAAGEATEDFRVNTNTGETSARTGMLGDDENPAAGSEIADAKTGLTSTEDSFIAGSAKARTTPPSEMTDSEALTAGGEEAGAEAGSAALGGMSAAAGVLGTVFGAGMGIFGLVEGIKSAIDSHKQQQVDHLNVEHAQTNENFAQNFQSGRPSFGSLAMPTFDTNTASQHY